MASRQTPETKMPQYAVHTNRKKRGRGKLIAALVVIFLAAAAYLLLGEFFAFTPDGLRFVYGQEKTPAESGEASSSGALLPDTADDALPRISIDRGELPPEGAGPIRGALLEASGRTQEDILSSAVNLKNLGYTAAVVPVKAADAARISAQELAWAAEACDTAGLRFVAYLSCFRDDVTPRGDPSLALCDAEGNLFVDYEYSAWLNPNLADARSVVLENCRFAVAGGADELLLDALCFPYAGNVEIIDYGGTEASPREVIGAFSAQLRETFTVRLGAVLTGDDTFGEGASETKGQDAALFAECFDRLWLYAPEEEGAKALAARLAVLTGAPENQICAVIGREYFSFSLFMDE